MNERGFVLISVMLIMLFLSVLTLNLISLYEYEKKFASLEVQRFELDQLMINAPSAVIAIWKDSEEPGIVEAELQYYEGTVHYVIESDLPYLFVEMTGVSRHGHAKQAAFIYNTELKTYEDWEEGRVWP